MLFRSGGKADVRIATGVAASGTAGPGALAVTVTATMTAGWNYLDLADPGAGYRVADVTRSDGRALPSGSFWQTDRSFPASGSQAVRENRLHILDENGTGSYTVTYVVDDTGRVVVEWPFGTAAVRMRHDLRILLGSRP